MTVVVGAAVAIAGHCAISVATGGAVAVPIPIPITVTVTRSVPVGTVLRRRFESKHPASFGGYIGVL